MSPGDLGEIAVAMVAAGVARLELTGPETRLVLGRGAAPPAMAETTPEAAPIAVKAPGVGTFLRGHPLHDHPFATSGDTVGSGQPLGVLQVGAVLLPVVAPAAGLVVDTAVEDRTLVGYGDRLFDLLPQD